MSYELLLSIIGTFGTMALLINGYFLRGIFQDMNEIKVKLAAMTARSEDKERRISLLEKKIEEM
ncbi:MAG: hypothetical protein ACTSUP_03905 [Candidatus Heimdallarchaeaceae archaeon]